MGHATRSVAVVLVALVVAALVALFVAGEPSLAREPTPTCSPANCVTKPHEVEQIKRAIEATKSTNEAERIAARAFVRKHFYKALPRLAPAVLKKPLLTAAAGAWTVVGLELYYLPCWECGERSVKYGAEVALHPDAISGFSRDSDGTVNAQGWVTRYKYSRTYSAAIDTEYSLVGYTRYVFYNGTERKLAYPPHLSVHATGAVTGGNPVFNEGLPPVADPVLPSPQHAEGSGWTTSGAITLDYSRANSGSGEWGKIYSKPLCPAGYSPCQGDVSPPTYAVGSVPEVTQLPEGAYVAPPDVTRRLHESMRQDPEGDRWCRPWLDPDFRALADAAGREAL